MTAWYLPAPPPSRARFAWAVSRKVGGAVVRNRLRRRLREAVEALARADQVPPGAYLVSVAPEAAALPYEELKENVAATLRAVSDGTGRSSGERDTPGPAAGAPR